MHVGVEYPTGKEMQRELAMVVDNSMTCVVPALVANHHMGLRSQYVYYAPLALISPLGSNHGCNWHGCLPQHKLNQALSLAEIPYPGITGVMRHCSWYPMPARRTNHAHRSERLALRAIDS